MEKKELMIDSYENQRDLKLQLDVRVREWKGNGQRASPPSESCFSLRSGKSGKSDASSRNSVQQKRRIVEGSKLGMHALRERLELQRELEEAEKGKAELSGKLELLVARTKVKQAEIDLLAEQSVEDEMKDGMNEYLEEYYTKGQPCNEPLPAPSANGVKPISKPRSLIGEQKATAPLTGHSFARSELPVLPVREYVETEAVVTVSSTPNVVSVTNIKTSSAETCAVSWPHSSERKVIFSSTVDHTRPMRTRVCTTV